MAQLLLKHDAKTGKLNLVGTMSEKVSKVRERWQKTMAGLEADIHDDEILDQLEALERLERRL